MFAYAVFLVVSTLSPREITGKATFADCGGPQKKIEIQGGSVDPDPIIYPGNISMSMNINVLEDLPADGFKMNLNLTKLDPFTMPVPCLKDIGSCSYDVCQMIQNHQELCAMFPPGAKCACPLKKAVYNMENALVVIPDFGEIFAKILKGHYEGTITFEDTHTNTEIGCIAVTFAIK